jgi:hypothetical protein
MLRVKRGCDRVDVSGLVRGGVYIVVLVEL